MLQHFNSIQISSDLKKYVYVTSVQHFALLLKDNLRAIPWLIFLIMLNL